jgi:hypothetical protein
MLSATFGGVIAQQPTPLLPNAKLQLYANFQRLPGVHNSAEQLNRDAQKASGVSVANFVY